MTFSAPRLYLANGVTTMRTTGSVEPDTDLSLKREIDAGHLVGPHLDVTGPYLEGLFAQSNLGIVTKAGIWLMPAPESYYSFIYELRDERNLSAATATRMTESTHG